MKTLKTIHPFFEKMVEAAVYHLLDDEEKRKIHAESPKKLELLVVGDGRMLGVSFLRFLESSATTTSAFDSWVKKHPALEEFGDKYKFFRPLMER